MDKQPLSAKITASPNFYLPPGLEFNNADSEDYATAADADEYSDGEFDGLAFQPDITDTDEVNTAIPVPQNITIVSQTVSSSPGGSQVVDVVLSIPDIVGVDNFELRVTK